MIKSWGFRAVLGLLGLLASPSAYAQTACSSLTQTAVLGSLADNVPPDYITPGTFRNLVCSTGNYLVTPTGGTADTLADWTAYLAGTATDPFIVTFAGIRTPGSVVAGSPTGGSLGAGTINATGLFVNGVPVSGGLAVPNSGLLGGNGTSLTAVAVGSGLGLSGGTLSVTGALAPTSVVVGSPTGGAQGTGTINATGIFINGTPVAGGLAVPNSGIIGGNGSTFTSVTTGTGLTLSGGTLSVTTPYNPTLVGITGGSINGTTVGISGPASGAFTSLVATGAVTGAGFTNLFASPVPLGSGTPNTGTFTTLSTTGVASISSAVVGNATGGALGTGTVNATGLYVNGVAVAGGLTVPNSNIIGGNGSTLTSVTVGSGLSFSAGSLSVTNPYSPSAVAITGGTVNGTAVGGSIPSTGAFTTLSSSGQLSPASVVVGSATGGNEGAGTVNATGIYVNGVAVAGGLSVPNASLIGGNGSSLVGVVVGSGLSFGSNTLTVSNPYVPGNVAITGGTINGTIIGNSIQAPGSFTTITTTGSNSLSTTGMTGKLTTLATGTTEGLNLGIWAVAPGSPSNGAIWMTSAGLFVRPNGSPIGPLGTVQSIATTSPILGGTISTSGTISCPTCATTISGGALSAVGPITLTAGGAIGLGNTQAETGNYWNASTAVTADQVVLSSSFPWITGTIQSIDYYTGGTGTPSYTGTVLINGVPVTGCSVTVNSSTPTLLHGCSASNTITIGQTLAIQTSSIAGVPYSSLFHIHYSHSNP